MKRSLVLTLLLVACTTAPLPSRGFESLERNPLMGEVMADQMLDAVVKMQIRANESGNPITDPTTLRAIDETFVVARTMRDRAHKLQDEGKMGYFSGVNDGFVEGRALLLGEALFFGYTFRAEPLPGMRVLLATHVSPKNMEELFTKEEQTRDVGPLQSPLGPQEYAAGALTDDEWNRFRTVVIYSDVFKRVFGIAQIRRSVRVGEEE